MAEAPRLIWRDPVLRMVAGLMLLQGALACAFGPYVPVLAVKTFGLGDRGYAGLMLLGTLVSVTAALAAGIRADQTADRRSIALGACALMVAGAGLMVVLPGPLTFVLAQGLLFPANTLFGQLFAQSRLASEPYPAERDAIQSTIRALFAAPYLVVLPLWSWATAQGVPLTAIYPVSLALALVMALVVWQSWPGPAAHDRPSGLSLRAALAELATPGLLRTILALGAVTAPGPIYWAVLGLVLTETGQGAEAPLYGALVAGLEVPFMLALPLVLKRPRGQLILIGTALYAVHLVGIPLLAGTPWLWLLVLPAAMGGALTLTLPISVLQDALSARPGTAAALMALMKVTGDAMAATCFALGTTLQGYALAAIIGAALSLGGAVLLLKTARP